MFRCNPQIVVRGPRCVNCCNYGDEGKTKSPNKLIEQKIINVVRKYLWETQIHPTDNKERSHHLRLCLQGHPEQGFSPGADY